jgi:hypothetical protein
VLGPKGLDVGDPLGGRTAAPERDIRLGLAETPAGDDLADHDSRIREPDHIAR